MREESQGMNWRPSNSDSSTSAAFSRLDERIQRWIWTQGWNELREIQEVAIDAMLTGALGNDRIACKDTFQVTLWHLLSTS